MPWKVSSVMEERLRFVARLLDGEAMTEVCREFGISRKTGYKILTRYNKVGLEGLTDRSRAALPPCQQVAHPDRDADRAPQAGQAELASRKTRSPGLAMLH
jgi:transposase-like protein